MIHSVTLSARARKNLRTVPGRVLDKLEAWIGMVELIGLEEVRKSHGFHDEPLGGDRRGQRSIRLSLAYRAIYVVNKGEIECAQVEEVSKHRY